MKDNLMNQSYKISRKALNKFIRENRRKPTEKEWNILAKENDYLSSKSMKYIMKLR